MKENVGEGVNNKSLRTALFGLERYIKDLGVNHSLYKEVVEAYDEIEKELVRRGVFAHYVGAGHTLV